MMGMGEKCPFEFNFDPATFKVGDMVSYRVASLADFPFVATIVAVHQDHLEIVDQGAPERVLRATLESRPQVSDEQALG